MRPSLSSQYASRLSLTACTAVVAVLDEGAAALATAEVKENGGGGVFFSTSVRRRDDVDKEAEADAVVRGAACCFC